jgi:Putative peptidoglycan binding domain
MSNKLLIGAAVLAAAIAMAACEKTPSGQSNQSGSVTSSEADQQAERNRTEPQQRSDQAPAQVARGETEQDAKSAQTPTGGSTQTPTGGAEQATKSGPAAPGATEAAPGATEQASKPSQLEPGGTGPETKSGQAESGATEQENERGGQQEANAGDRSNAENGSVGQPSPKNGITAQNEGGTPEPSATQPNQPQQGQAQQSQQSQQARDTVDLNPEHGNAAIGGPVNLSRDELRHVQMVLKEKGFNVGTADGVLGPRTRNALLAFQRQQGLEATGKIDQRTMTALGMSNRTGSTTTGQSGAGTQ